MTEELIPLDTDVAVDESEDTQTHAVVRLLDYDQTSEQKVLQGVKAVFKGFDYTKDSVGIKFNTTADLAAYTQNTMNDIKAVSRSTETERILHKAAMMARFWYLGDTINKALKQGKWGTAAVQELAATLKKSVPYIYQIRAVAVRLTPVDCYLLGMRDLDSSHLRKLAQIKDDAIRTDLIHAFIKSITDTADPERLAQAKKQLNTALNMKEQLPESTESSDPENGGSEIEVSAEYTEVLAQIKKALSAIKKIADPVAGHDLRLSMSEFFLMDDVPDAQVKLDELKTVASDFESALRMARDSIDDTIAEVVSLQLVELTKSDL